MQTIGRLFKLLKPCGAKGIRTPDLLNAIQTLSQLSYSPKMLELKRKFR